MWGNNIPSSLRRPLGTALVLKLPELPVWLVACVKIEKQHKSGGIRKSALQKFLVRFSG